MYVNYILPFFLLHFLLAICRRSTFCGLTFWRRSAAEAASIRSRALAGQNESDKQNGCQSGRKWYVFFNALWYVSILPYHSIPWLLRFWSHPPTVFFFRVSCLWHSLTLRVKSAQLKPGCRIVEKHQGCTGNALICISILLQWFASHLQFPSVLCFAKAEFPRCVAAPKSERACAATGEAVIGSQCFENSESVLRSKKRVEKFIEIRGLDSWQEHKCKMWKPRFGSKNLKRHVMQCISIFAVSWPVLHLNRPPAALLWVAAQIWKAVPSPWSPWNLQVRRCAKSTPTLQWIRSIPMHIYITTYNMASWGMALRGETWWELTYT